MIDETVVNYNSAYAQPGREPRRMPGYAGDFLRGRHD